MRPNGAADMKLELAGRLDDGYLTRDAEGSEKPSFGAEVGGVRPTGIILRGRVDF